MKKNSLVLVLLFMISAINAQKSQRIAYIDMEYILQNIPEYMKAKNSLATKVEKWKTNLDKQARAIEVLKTDLANEKAILTKELIEEREEDISVKEQNFKKLENSYFGVDGAMYTVRKQLVQPVQDQVYNAVQTIASRKKYDFVFDKSSELVMLYSNKKHDISELVVKLINIDQKKKARADKIAERKALLDKESLTDKQKELLAKKEALKNKRAQEKQDKYNAIEKKRLEKLKAKEEKRKLLLEKREALRKARLEKKKALEENKK